MVYRRTGLITVTGVCAQMFAHIVRVGLSVNQGIVGLPLTRPPTQHLACDNK